MRKTSSAVRRAVVTALAMAATPAMPALAQEAEGGRNIETIIVTAQKREQSLQDVPIVVTAVSGQLLQDTGVRDIKDLTILTPGLIVTSTSNETVTTARIRGIGTVGDNPGLESSVGVVIDGVYRPRNGVSFGDLGQMDRIEVLKGPQGTLFGKNTSAGVINILTRRPQFEFGSEVELTAGNYSALEGSASLTGPIVGDAVAGSLFVAARERDGYYDVVRGPGPRQEDEDFDRSFYTVRGQLLFQPTSALDIRLIADYTSRDENCCLAPQAVLTPTPAVLAVLNALEPGSFANPADPFERVTYANRGTEQSIHDKGVSMEINWDMDGLGGATLTSVSALRNWETVNGQDADFTTVDIWYREANGNFGNEFDMFSQELRLAGETDQVSWLFGAFYAREDLDARNQLIYGNHFRPYFNALLQGAVTAFPPNAWPAGFGTRDVYEQESKTWALFTNNSFRVTDRFEITLGLRYTDESKDLDAQYFNEHGGVGCTILRSNPAFVNSPAAATIFGIGCGNFADPVFNNQAFSQSINENEWSGTAKLAYRFSDEVMSYASYARGYKASGFNLDRERIGDPRIAPLNPLDPRCTPAASPAGPICLDTDTRFDKELVDSYELGIKTQWLGNSLMINGALFYQDYENFQLNTFTGIQFVVTSLPQVISQGVDLDFMWFTPLDQLSLQGGVTWADTQIEDFGAAEVFFRPERENDRLSFAPRWSGSLSATFEQPFGNNLLWRTNVGTKYTSHYNTGSNLDVRKRQGAMALVNARIGIGAENESWMVEAWAQNLTDKEYYQVAFDAPLQGSSSGAVPTSTINAFLGAPRTYGVTARFKF